MTRMVHLLLATFNGALHLPAMLESLRRQTWTEWTLLIRDDGSYDGTRRLIKEHACRDDRVEVIRDEQGNQGAKGNFGLLMRKALERKAGYIFFADQDDVWSPRKIETQMEAMRANEDQFGLDTPLLVHTDLALVDKDLQPLHPSVAKYSRLIPSPAPLRNLLVYNNVTGCATLINQALLRVSAPLPQAAVMHDWWLALCASAFGKVIFLDRPMVDYRQHETNVVGSTNYWAKLNPWGSVWKAHCERYRRVYLQSIYQAAELERRLHAKGWTPHHQAAHRLVSAYTKIFSEHRGSYRRWWKIYRLGVGRVDLFRRVDLTARVFSVPHFIPPLHTLPPRIADSSGDAKSTQETQGRDSADLEQQLD